MLAIVIPAREQWDENRGEFITSPEQKLVLEHSLVSISKWESKWHKPFLSKIEPKTFEETIDYIKCMTLTQNVNPNVYYNITNENLDAITEYINNPMTATRIKSENTRKNREIVTSELIYYWMISQNIPFECQKWHLNRLLTLIQVCSEKNKPPKKMSRSAVMKNNASLNAARRASLGTRG